VVVIAVLTADSSGRKVLR